MTSAPTMMAEFQSSYQRMEQSLQRLTDSIAAYNPSIAAADELAAADDVVNEQLERLVEHQRNYARILELKRTTSALDQTIKTHIRQFAEARKELLAIPISEIDDSRPSFNVNEVLAYAKFIGPTTVPPTFRKQPKTTSEGIEDSQSTGYSQAKNGMTTSPLARNASELPSNKAEAGNTLDERDRAWIGAQESFEPWPSHDVIARGTLADMQKMVERGIDPASILTAEEQAEADKQRKEEEERERVEQEERERRRAQLFDTGGRRTASNDVFNPDD
nr:mediator of rna polymerase ii transcription subunit 4 [Quercus suber]